MRATVVLTVDDALAEFMNSQQGLMDPSALINQLIHEEMAAHEGNKGDPARLDDPVLVEQEAWLDADTHAAE